MNREYATSHHLTDIHMYITKWNLPNYQRTQKKVQTESAN